MLISHSFLPSSQAFSFLENSSSEDQSQGLLCPTASGPEEQGAAVQFPQPTVYQPSLASSPLFSTQTLGLWLRPDSAEGQAEAAQTWGPAQWLEERPTREGCSSGGEHLADSVWVHDNGSNLAVGAQIQSDHSLMKMSHGPPFPL